LISSSLLTTKFYLPAPASDLVTRPRLLQRLDAGLTGKLILISAPAGFGKTTLVASWLQRVHENGSRVCWLSLDEGDNDQAGFWIYILTALQMITGSSLGEVARAAFQAPQPSRIETVLVSLINDIAAVEQQLILVLDDYHTIHLPEIHAALDFFIEHLPRTLRLVIATRENPHLALSRLRARGQLVEIRAADLRFSAPETSEFLNGSLNLDLTVADINALAERTEGWIAGLHLAALSLQNEADPHNFIGAFTASHRFLTDYLVDEVLSRQEPVLRDFMIRSAVMHQLNPELCNYVFEITNSQQLLRRLDEANLFLVPLDNDRRWYRYHHLFAQFLLLRLHETEGQTIPVYTRRAMDWCSAHGYQREALGYALEAKSFEQAAQIIEGLAPGIMSAEGPSLVLQWIKALPDPLVRQHPTLCVHYAWALTFAGRTVEALDYLGTAETLAALLPEKGAADIIGYIAAHRTYLQFFQGDYRETIRFGKQALTLLPEQDTVMRARTATFLGNGLRYAGDFAGAEQTLAQAESLALRTGSLYIANMCYTSLAELHNERGKLAQAISAYQRGLEFNQRHAGRPDIPLAGFTYAGIGRTEREWNHLEEALSLLTKGVALCHEGYQIDLLALSLMELSLLQRDLGAYDQARQSLAEAREITQQFSSDWGVATVDGFLARIEIAAGNLDEAQHWANNCGINLQDEWHFERGVEYETLWRLLIVQEKYADSLLLLNQLYSQYKPAGRWGRLVEILAWQARAYAGLSDLPRAVEAIQEALAIAEPGGYMRSFLETGQPLVQVLQLLPPSAYCDRLLEAFAASAEADIEESAGLLTPDTASSHTQTRGAQRTFVPPNRDKPGDGDPLSEPLNEREIAVLRLLAAGLSNNEIGAELYLSVNTIRWYASQIYQKLGVSSRGAAAARARELRII
jgi:LuxR family transcriptional regulator, maltose regulon positive regulatory protein